MNAIFKVKAEGRTRLIVFDTEDLTIGRSPENDLAFDDPEMSRKHAYFLRKPNGCRLQDLGTANGTDVNNESVDHAELVSGDVVSVGEVELTYAETTRDPSSLGASVEYASQLKGFATPLPEGDGEVTMLGLGQPVGASADASAGAADTEDSVSNFELDAALDILDDSEPAAEAAPDDAHAIDLGEGDDEIGFDFESGEELGGADPGAEVSAEDAKGASATSDVWELEDDPVLGSDTDLESDAFDAPATELASVTAPDAARSLAGPSEAELTTPDFDDPLGPETPSATTTTLTLEIEGLEGDLRRVLESFAGKTLELPALRIRLKSDDLG